MWQQATGTEMTTPVFSRGHEPQSPSAHKDHSVGTAELAAKRSSGCCQAPRHPARGSTSRGSGQGAARQTSLPAHADKDEQPEPPPQSGAGSARLSSGSNVPAAAGGTGAGTVGAAAARGWVCRGGTAGFPEAQRGRRRLLPKDWRFWIDDMRL